MTREQLRTVLGRLCDDYDASAIVGALAQVARERDELSNTQEALALCARACRRIERRHILIARDWGSV